MTWSRLIRGLKNRKLRGTRSHVVILWKVYTQTYFSAVHWYHSILFHWTFSMSEHIPHSIRKFDKWWKMSSGHRRSNHRPIGSCQKGKGLTLPFHRFLFRLLWWLSFLESQSPPNCLIMFKQKHRDSSMATVLHRKLPSYEGLGGKPYALHVPTFSGDHPNLSVLETFIRTTSGCYYIMWRIQYRF